MISTIILVLIVVIAYLFASLSNVYGEVAIDPDDNLIISNETIDPLNQFNFGKWAFPLLATNFFLLGVGILYQKNKIPEKIQNFIKFIFEFEVSQKIALLVIATLLTLYVGFSVGELQHEETLGDYPGVKEAAENWSFENLTIGGTNIRYFLLNVSLNIFDNIRVIPFIASISLLILIYFITFEISKKRFAGIVAMVIVLQSNLFLQYDTIATYTNFWTLFYLSSLYLIYKSWFLSPIFYVLSIFSKPLTTIFLPMTLFFTYRADITKRKKILTLISYGIIVFFGIAAYLLGIWDTHYDGFYPDGFLTGFKEFSNFLQSDGLITLFLLPLVVRLFIASRKGVQQAESLMVLIAGILLSAPLLGGLTLLTNQPYRFIPLVVFFAIGVGIILSRNNVYGQHAHKKGRLASYLVFSVTLTIVLVTLLSVIFPSLIQGQYRIVL